jgi:hypothetical protein
MRKKAETGLENIRKASIVENPKVSLKNNIANMDEKKFNSEINLKIKCYCIVYYANIC